MNAAGKKRIAVAISGGGRSLENLLKTAVKPDCSFTIAGVIASRPDIKGCEIARQHHLPLLVLPFSKADMPDTETRLYAWLGAQKIDLVALAGFLKHFPVQKDWSHRVVNIHPALLPKYGGKGMYGHHVHEAVVRAGERQSGATIHYVNGQYDEGQMIAQVSVDLKRGQTADEVAALVFAAECHLYPLALQGIASGDLPLKNQEVYRCKFEPK